jgi:predicted enzyme related to lactoylglutathione lyase
MPTIDKHPHGSFCWMELSTTDQNAAKQFYSALFGWQPADFPMGPSEVYTIFRSQGRDCSAACTLRKDLIDHGVPPHWMLYIATDNVDDSTRRAGELGARIMAGPFDVGESGRMSVIQDPTGAHFCLWQGKGTAGIGIAGEQNTFCWADLNPHDRAAAQKFYSGLFGWTFDAGEGKDASGYLHIANSGQMIGGMPPSEHLPKEVPPHWLLYYLTDNCAALTARATGLGASVCVPIMTIENTGVISILNDPQGAGFALFEPSRMPPIQ